MAKGDEREGEGGRSEGNDDRGHCEWVAQKEIKAHSEVRLASRLPRLDHGYFSSPAHVLPPMTDGQLRRSARA